MSIITEKEKIIAHKCVEYALRHGASAVRVSLNKSTNDGCTILNGELDKVTHAADRSVFIYIYADSRYGTFSTNRLSDAELEEFISGAIRMVKMLGEDACRSLPEPDRTAKDAVTGLELGLYDGRYLDADVQERLDRAHAISIIEENAVDTAEGYTVLSEECEYNESFDDMYLIDSQGFEGRHTETSFSCFSEITIADKEGNRFSGYWWDMSPEYDRLDFQECGRNALQKAVSQIGPKKRRSGRYRMVVDRNVASRLVSPLINALNATSIQQKMSFLEGTKDRKVFSEGMTLKDMARTPGKTGSRLFDSEGVSTTDAPVIENGVVKKYFVNTYMANKMGISPTVEDISRPCLMPYMKGNPLMSGEKSISLEDILRYCGSGILVTGFNGGNSNPVTGDFSFGIEGFAFSRGKITHPVREMLITGNLTGLWNNLTAVGTDARSSSRWQIPTMAFEEVSFSGE